MNNVNVRIVGTANVTQMSGAFGKLESQVTALNAKLAQMVSLQNGVDAAGYDRMARAAERNNRVFKSAVASTGMFEQQQLRINKATDDYIDKLKRQKLSFREMIQQRKVAAAAYKEQLAMESMVMRQQSGATRRGRQVLDVAYPRQISADLDTAANKLSFFNEQLKSGAHQMVNWGKNTQWAGRQLMVGFTMPIAAAGAAAGVLAYQIDKEFTRIRKVYDSTADANSTNIQEQMRYEKEMQQLRQDGMATAIKSAKEYGAAATDTLNIQAELAATGKSGAELQRTTAEVMRIARLGEIEYQDALSATIALQSTFRMNNDELTKSFNYMNAVENATSLATADFAAAIPIAAAPVKQFGGDIQELGVLLTAMKERGIAATQGANAIKAAMQRLGRPSKQVQEEWKAITGTDITKIFEDSTSLIDMFQRISDATEGLGNKEQIKAFAGLFGTYQVTRMSALVEGMRDLESGVGQVSDAYKIAEGSATDWAKTADREMKAYQESISGRFDTAFQEFKAQVSTLGEPFVKVATVIMRSVSAIIEHFNKLPDTAKVIIATGVAMGAIAGPAVMLAGLFGNLFGNGLKAIAAFMTGLKRLTGGMNIATTEQRAAAMAAELNTTSMTKEASAVQMLRIELQKLTLAQASANRASREARVASMVEGGMSRSGAYAALAAERRRDLRNAGMMNDKGQSTAALGAALAAERNAEAAGKASKHWKNVAIGVGTAAAAGSVFLMESEGIVGNAAKIIFWASLLGPTLTPAIKGMNSGFKTASGWLAIQTKQFKTNLALARETAAAQAAGAAAGAGGGVGGVGKRGALKGAGAKITGGLGAALAAPGPAGWAIAAGVGGYMLYDKMSSSWEKVYEKSQQVKKNQADIVTLTRDWAKQQENVTSKFKTYADLTATTTGLDKNYYEKQLEFYKSKENKGAIDEYQNMDPSGRGSDLQRRYIDLINLGGMNPKQAQASMTAFLRATGMGLAEAAREAATLRKELGNLKDVDWATQAKNDLAQLMSGFEATTSGEPLTEKWKAQVQQFAPIFNQAFLSLDQEGATKVMDNLAQSVYGQWDKLATKLAADTGDKMSAGLRTAAEQGGEALRAYYLKNGADAFKGQVEQTQTYYDATSGANKTRTVDANFGGVLSNLSEMEKYLIRQVAESGDLAGNVDDLSSFMNNAVVRASMLSFKSAQSEAQQLVATLAGTLQGPGIANLDVTALGGNYKEIRERFAKIRSDAEDNAIPFGDMLGVENKDLAELDKVEQAVTAFAEANNIKVGKDWIATYLNLMRGVKNETEGGNSALDRMKAKATSVAGAYQSAFASISMSDVKGMMQSGMAGVQQDIADGYREAFDDSMNNALDSRQDMWDRRAEAQANKFEKQNRQMDLRWERKNDAAEKYWDNRVKGIQKAIDAEEKAEDKRQKMFDAEMERIDRLNEAMNRNIDFNVALNTGQFDEAAKIRNDVSAATAQTSLQSAADAGAGRSAARVEGLEGRMENAEEARDRQMKRLKKQEDAERRHLERTQRMRERALQRQTEADMEAQRDIWNARKKSLEDQLELFLAFTASNEKQLKKHMKRVGLSYDEFGKHLKKRGDTWGSFYGDALKHHVRKAGLELATDRMWKKMGENAATEMLKGIGFKNLPEFRYFIRTGEMGGNPNQKRKSGGDAVGRPGQGQAHDPTRHTGGWADNSPGSRKGVARTTKGLHNSEVMVRAQRGEFIVNKRDAADNADILETINSGKMKPDTNRGNIGHGKGGGSAPGMAGLLMAAINRGIASGVANKVKSTYQQKSQALGGSGGTFGAGTAGIYGDRAFSMAQLRNAATIASVGSRMGMSGRDLMIGIMTAITESGLVNVQYGDRDSLGLFQQRPSMGWGTPAQVTNPEYAARKFFDALKGVGNRGSMSPWAAAQAVQRSAFSDGSNYRQYWDEATAIFQRGLSRNKGGYNPAGGGVNYAPGGGGLHKASIPGKGWSNSHDYRNGLRSPLYAVDDGRIVESRALPPSAGSGQHPNAYPRGYGSYGVTVVLKTKRGDNIRYAHMWPGTNIGLGPVKGGTQIGLSAATGNASGPHTHFEANGSYNAKEWFANHGIPLKIGGTIKQDGTPAVLHKGERVMTAPLTSKLDAGIDALYKATKVNARSADRNQMSAALAFAKRQIGKPYTWGGVGPGGYDCSGMQSAIVNVIKGRRPHNRLFSTGTMASALPGLGFRRGRGGSNAYTVGWYTGSPGHTSGRIGNYNIESTGDHVRGGRAARSPGSFPNKMYLPLRGASIPGTTPSNPGSGDRPRPIDKAWDAAVNPSKPRPFKYPGMGTGAADSPYTYFNVEDMKAKAAAGIGDAAAAMPGFRTGTYNLYRKSSNARSKGDLERLMKQSDILSLTEFIGAKRGLKDWIYNQGWGLLGQGGAEDAAIAFNKDKYNLLNRGTRKLSNKGRKGAFRDRNAIYGLFEDKETGRKFWQIAAHTVGHAQRGNPGWEEVMRAQYAGIRNLVKDLKETGHPIFLAGDFNTNSKRSNIKHNFGLTSTGVGLDRIFSSIGRADSSRYIRNLSSDHPALLGQFDIPAMATGGDIKWNNTLANLHKDERVLTAPLTKKLDLGLDRLANGGGTTYNDIKVFASEGMDEEALANKVVKKLAKMDSRKPGSRRG